MPNNRRPAVAIGLPGKLGLKPKAPKNQSMAIIMSLTGRPSGYRSHYPVMGARPEL